MSKKKQDFIDKELNKASKTLLRKSKKQPAALILVLLIALVLYVKNDTDLFSGQGTGTAGTSAEELQAEGVEEAELTSITDGDTIWVRLNGEKEKIRLLEINTPESVHSDESRNTTFGEEASDYMKSLLEDVDTLYLTRDETDRDQYGRLLRMVWLERPEDPGDQGKERQRQADPGGLCPSRRVRRPLLCGAVPAVPGGGHGRGAGPLGRGSLVDLLQ